MSIVASVINFVRSSQVYRTKHPPCLAAWLSGIALDSINEVTLRRPRLVLGWVTVSELVNHLGLRSATEADSALYAQPRETRVPAKVRLRGELLMIKRYTNRHFTLLTCLHRASRGLSATAETCLLCLRAVDSAAVSIIF